MRKPNGYGSIKHLSGRRRRPFVFVVSEAGRQRPVEYFVTQTEAEITQTPLISGFEDSRVILMPDC